MSRMQHTFKTLLLISCAVAGVFSDCFEMSHNGCDGDDEQSYLKLQRDRDLCQQYCSIEPKCRFWRWTEDNRYGYNCFLYEEDFNTFVNHCQFISGPKVPNPRCVTPVEGSCDVTQQARCGYSTNTLDRQIADNQDFCQQACAINSQCTRWVYNKESQECETLGEEKQDCKETFGPKQYTPVECGETPETTTQPSGSTISPPIPENCPADSDLKTYADNDDCMYFWQCYKGVWTHEMCSDCDKYDPESGYCKQPNIVDCGNRPYDNNCKATTAPGLCPFQDGYFPYTDNCIKYIQCQGGLPTTYTCQTKVDENGVSRQLLYDDDKIMCEWTYRTSCGNRPVCDDQDKNCQCQGAEPVTPGQVCPADSVPTIIPDPFNCRRKIVCANGEEFDSETCPDGQYVEDSGALACVADENVCGDRPICAESGGAASCYCV